MSICTECGSTTSWEDGSAVCTNCGTLVDASQCVLVVQDDYEHTGQTWVGAQPKTLKSVGSSGWHLAGQSKQAHQTKNMVIASFIA